MSRHRSPQGRQGETTFVVDPDGSLPESSTADRLADPRPVAGPDTGLLPHPRVSRSGPIPVVRSGPRFSDADAFAAALGLPPLGEPGPSPAVDGLGGGSAKRDDWSGHRVDSLVPSPRSSPAAAPGGGQDADVTAPEPDGGEAAVPAPRFAASDAAFQTVIGWRPDEPDLVAARDAEVEWPEDRAFQSSPGGASAGEPTSAWRLTSPVESSSGSWPTSRAEPASAEPVIGQPTSAEKSGGAVRSVGGFGWSSPEAFSSGQPPACGRQPDPWTPGWTSFGDFQPGADPLADPLSDPLGIPLAEHPLGHHRMGSVPALLADAEVTADLPRLSDLGEPTDAADAPEGPVGERTGTVASAPAPVNAEFVDQSGTPYGGESGAARAEPAEEAAVPTAAVAFVPAATFQPATDRDLHADLDPLPGSGDEVDEAGVTTVLGSDTPNRQRREPAKRARAARRGRRPSNRLIALAAAGVVLVIVGVTVLVGYGKSLWSSPEHASDTHSGAPAPAPVPTPPPGDDAARAKKQADATKKAPPNADAPDAALSLANCTKRVGDGASLQQALASAAPGQKICATGGAGGGRLKVTRSGTPSAPITVIGTGSTPVNGITIEASNVIVGGFTMTNPPAPGIQLTGNNITVRNNTVKHPVGDDFDGLRFFGTNLKILNNVITDINKDGTDAHADCMQTFATNESHPASQNVLIAGNRCERIGSQCLMAEGPNSTAGDGSGVGRSANITFSNNFCQAGAVQAVKIDDVQGVRLVGNTITGTPHKAFAILNNATGAMVSANKVSSNIGYQVGMDSSSRSGYQGPPIGGDE
jgi:Right handed beta helix region